MQLLDGLQAAQHYNQSYAEQVKKYTDIGHRPPHLVAILVGDDVASQTYVRNKIKTCNQIGYNSSLRKYNANLSQEELLQSIRELNQDTTVDGILVQLPLPPQIDEHSVIYTIAPDKDVDGFHPTNIGKMVLSEDTFVSATPLGIIQLLDYYDIDTTGMHCAVIGRSNIVGTPISILLSRNALPGNASVTLCHSRTRNLQEITQQADLVVAAIGKPEFVTPDMVKEGAIVIDVGINKKDDSSKKKGYRLVGDVNYDQVAPKTSYISPVPRGVGPMTISALMANTLKAYQNNYIKNLPS